MAVTMRISGWPMTRAGSTDLISDSLTKVKSARWSGFFRDRPGCGGSEQDHEEYQEPVSPTKNHFFDKRELR